MSSIEFSANIFAKAKFTTSAGKNRLYASKDCPDFQVQSSNGKMFLVLNGTVSDFVKKTWDGNPKPTYDRKIEIRLGLASCEKMMCLLQEQKLIQIQVKSTKQGM